MSRSCHFPAKTKNAEQIGKTKRQAPPPAASGTSCPASRAAGCSSDFAKLEIFHCLEYNRERLFWQEAVAAALFSKRAAFDSRSDDCAAVKIFDKGKFLAENEKADFERR